MYVYQLTYGMMVIYYQLAILEVGKKQKIL